MLSASGSREVPESRAQVWAALAALDPYCAVCDVSYVVGEAPVGTGTTFVCVPGRLGGGQPPAGAPRGEILAWEPRRTIGTRLTLTSETWTTRIELADADGGTRVTLTVTLEPEGGHRLVQRIQRSAAQRLVERTVESELDKIPAHLEQATARD